MFTLRLVVVLHVTVSRKYLALKLGWVIVPQLGSLSI
jgi:hypothetical protein